MYIDIVMLTVASTTREGEELENEARAEEEGGVAATETITSPISPTQSEMSYFFCFVESVIWEFYQNVQIFIAIQFCLQNWSCDILCFE